MRISPYRILLFLAKTWTILAIIVIVYTALHLPRSAESTDYVMNFYVAGHLAASGEPNRLYPEPDAASFTGSPFNKAAHALLPELSQSLTAAYMYSPAVALIFAPLSTLKPNLSLLLWQGISLIALALSCFFLSKTTNVKASDTFFLSFLFFPVFITLWIGQLSIVLGLLPLCGGYLLLMKDRPFLAGLCWSCLALKPQLLPAAGFVTLVLATAGRPQCLAGAVLGGAGLLAANLILFPSEITLSWLKSFRVSDAIFSAGMYTLPTHLVTSLPSSLLMLYPVSQRSLVKLPLYVAVAALWLIGFWRCRRLARANLGDHQKVSLMIAIGLILLPLVVPHMLYYDLCTLVPVGVILLRENLLTSQAAFLKGSAWAVWLAISSYFPLFLAFDPNAIQPLVLESVLLMFFAGMLWTFNKISLAAEFR